VYNSAHDPIPPTITIPPGSIRSSASMADKSSPSAHGISRLGTPWRVQLPELHAACWYNAEPSTFQRWRLPLQVVPAPRTICWTSFKYVSTMDPRIQRRHQHRAVRRLVLRDGHRLELASELYRPARHKCLVRLAVAIRTSNLLMQPPGAPGMAPTFPFRSSIRI